MKKIYIFSRYVRPFQLLKLAKDFRSPDKHYKGVTGSDYHCYAGKTQEEDLSHAYKDKLFFIPLTFCLGSGTNPEAVFF